MKPCILSPFMPHATLGVQDICSVLSPGAWGAGTASAVYPAANLAIYAPFRIAAPIVVTDLWCVNGATASGNVDIGIYDGAGNKIVSAGSTAQSGTSTIQTFNITDTLLGGGLFYLAIALDNTTGTFLRFAPSAPVGRIIGLAQQASAFALPATATFATFAQTYLPNMGLSTTGAA